MSADQHTVSATEPANQHTMFAGMSTQTATETVAAAITLGASQDTSETKGQVKAFITQPDGGNGNPPSGPPASGHIPRQGGSGGGSRGGGGGGGGTGGGTAAGNQGRGGKLSGNPPSEFNGNRTLADAFINEFNLYHIANIDAEQMTSPMKQAALFLRFIKGPNVKDWVKKWTNWTIREFTAGRPLCDDYYWDQVFEGFQQAFQDTGAREQAEDRL